VGNARRYAVITADIVGSRKIPAFRSKRDTKLRAISRLHLKKQLILSPYAVTAWDEFQAILRKPDYLPQVIWDLRRLFRPYSLWLAVGMGEVSEAHRRPVNVYAGGSAFERARLAADRLKSGNPKFTVLTAFESGNAVFDSIANTLYHLHDTLLDRTTEKQWTVINMQTETGRQEVTARKLSLDISTVSRNLKRGSYWQFEETRKAMEQIIPSYF
jgi:SatD family (SatD)